MALVRDRGPAKHLIQGYRPGEIRIDNIIHTGNLVLLPNALMANWPPADIHSLSAKDLLVIPPETTLLLLGTGENLVFPPCAVYGELISRGTGVEIMGTPAACRTWNALVLERRHIAAALFLR